MYQDAWRLDSVSGVRGSLTTFVGLAALLLQIALLSLARSALRAMPMNWLLSVTASIVNGLVLWICIPWLLLDGRVHWRRLLPTAVVASLCGAASAVRPPSTCRG